jgi:transposase
VPVKDVDQQARLAFHRVREGYKTESLAIGNRLRGLLAEFGMVVAQSDAALRRVLADLDQAILPEEFKTLIRGLQAHWAQVRAALDACDARVEAHARADAHCVRRRPPAFSSGRF